ncbi:hypothetical protein SNE26_24600 [Mucilaginibacter sp. cycad4]|uniref:hypothetical protein n=1 Tax=Mucilaginibacter sp. cycad4 TaxID=3342096 RepID=UPI002AAAEDD0|nr:hypothetical protein [Mucilaginibacter gossypii]WPU99197.1 hypothetical protein SNE26_24600 [Mucilaginibacter gossypii]
MSVIKQFDIVYDGAPATVTEHDLKSGRVFRIEFSKRALLPLIITVAHDEDDKKFWTSIPEGRQALAEEVGKLVASYLRSNIQICVTTTDKKSPVPSLFD